MCVTKDVLGLWKGSRLELAASFKHLFMSDHSGKVIPSQAEDGSTKKQIHLGSSWSNMATQRNFWHKEWMSLLAFHGPNFASHVSNSRNNGIKNWICSEWMDLSCYSGQKGKLHDSWDNLKGTTWVIKTAMNVFFVHFIVLNLALEAICIVKSVC